MSHKFTESESVHQLSNGRWVVARWAERAAQYQAPTTTAERRVTGCHTYYADTIDGISGGYTYSRRADALRRARDVYEEN